MTVKVAIDYAHDVAGGQTPDGRADGDGADDSSGGTSIIDKILSMFFGGADPDREKRRLLKALGKDLTRDRYKFYKPRGTEVQPNFGRFFYEIYRSVGPLRKLIQPSDLAGSLRMAAIEQRLTDRQLALREQIEETRLRERARSGVEIKKLADEVKEQMIAFVGTFDAPLVKSINETFAALTVFIRFCHFDYYFTLKKMDSSISEDSFTYKPRFEAITAEYVVDDIRDWLELALALPETTDWDAVFDLMKAYRNVEVIDRDLWRKVIKGIRDVLASGILEQIVQHGSEDPYWKPKIARETTRIVEPYLNDLRSGVEEVLQRIAGERRGNKIEQLVKNVFGTTIVTRARNYTAKASMALERGDVTGYLYTDALNYLKAYLLDYFKKDVREIVQDLLIVRGKWTTNIQSQQISDAYHGVLQVSEQLIALDDSLAEEGELGMKIRRAAGRIVDRDPSSAKPLREMLTKINDGVLALVTEAAQSLIIIGKNLKMLIDDYDRREGEIITNWRELDGLIEDSLRDRMNRMYRQLYFLVQLLQVYAQKH